MFPPSPSTGRSADRLDVALAHHQVVVVVAPAGAGKTHTLRQWAAGTRDSVDPPAVYWGIPADPGSAPGVVLIDDADVENAQSSAAGGIDDTLLTNLVAHGHRVVLTGRHDPPIAVQRRVGRAEAVVLGFADLVLDERGVAELADAAGLTANETFVNAVHSYTSGWPAPTRLVLESVARTDGSVVDPRAHGRSAKDYLRNEVLDPMPDDLRAAYRALAPLETITTDLVRAVLEPEAPTVAPVIGRPDDPSLPTADEGSRRRVPDILREVLEECPGSPSPSHRVVFERAAVWFEAREEWEQALAHMLRASPSGAIEQARRLLTSTASRPVGQSAAILRMLEGLPLDLRVSPDATLGLAVALIQNGLRHEAAVLLARVDPLTWRTTDLIAEYWTVLAFVHRSLFDHDRTVDAAERALRELDSIDDAPSRRVSYLRLRSTNPLIEIDLWNGDLDAARRRLELVQPEVPTAASAIASVRNLGLAAMLAFDTGRARDAESLALQTIREAESAGHGNAHINAEATFVLGALQLEHGDPDSAMRHLGVARRMAADGQYPTTAARIEFAAIDCAIDRHDIATAEALLDNIPTRIGSPRDDPALTLRVAVSHIDRHVALGNPAHARRSFDTVLTAVLDNRTPGRYAVRAVAYYALAANLDDLFPRIVSLLEGAVEPDPADAVISSLVRTRMDADRDADDRSALSVHPVDRLVTALGIADRWGLDRTVRRHAIGVEHALRALVESPPPDAPARLRRRAQALLDAGSSRSPLSERETAVARLLPTRMTNREMAENLSITSNTVKTHVRHIYEKLGVTRRIEAVERLSDLGIVPRS